MYQNCDPMKLESCRTFKIHNNGRRGHREGERVHLLLYVFVTAPVFQLDTSELNADANANTRRVEVRVPQRKERPTHSQTTNSNGPKHKQNM
jgi:hypothetical protein